MGLGKSIRVYLKEGTVTGLKLAEVVNLTIQALSCPRIKLPELNNFFSKEVNKPGVYFLLGLDDKTSSPKVYIGEAENVWSRLRDHETKKDFWNEVLLFTSKDDNLTKSHVKYLESNLILISVNAGRYIIDNTNNSNSNLLPLSDRDAMEEFTANIKLLTGTLGHTFLEPYNEPNGIEENTAEEKHKQHKPKVNAALKFMIKIKDVTAKAIQTNEGIVVFKGSNISEKEARNYGYKTLRQDLIANGTIKKRIFTKDYLFKSPSAAAAVIVGYSINGRTVWKNNNGETLKEIEENELQTLTPN